MNYINKIFKGYLELLLSGTKSIKAVIKIILFLIFILILSFLIVFPLWSFATKSPDVYTIFVGITVITLIIFYIIYKMVISIKTHGFINCMKPILKKGFSFILFIIVGIALIFLFSFSVLLGILFSIIILTVIGFVKFAFKN